MVHTGISWNKPKNVFLKFQDMLHCITLLIFSIFDLQNTIGKINLEIQT